MNLIKKLILAPLFLLSFIYLIYLTTSLFKSYDFVFSLSFDTFLNLVTITGIISLSSLLFILLATFAQDWIITMPAAIAGSAVAFVFIEPSLALIFTAGAFGSLVLANLNIDIVLKSYLNFQPFNLLGPPAKHLTKLLILTICIVYFFSSSKIISQNGFAIPDSLIDTALKFTPNESSLTQETSQLSIPSEQIELLKKNPDLLKQSGLDPKILDTLNSPKSQNTPNELIKQTIKDQIQGFLKPYISFIPVVLALLLFLTLQSLSSIVNLLIHPLLWIIFYILEKTGFIRFEVEQRPVKKMVI